MTLLTVLLPTIGRDTLSRAVESICRQTVPTSFIIHSDVERIGAGPTLNKMLPSVATPWLMTMGDDDILAPNCAELLSEQDQNADMVIFQMEYPNGLRLPRSGDVNALTFGSVGCSYAVKTEMAKKVGFLDRPCAGMLAEDWEMISAVRGLRGDIRVVLEVAYYVRPARDDSKARGRAA